MWNPSKINTHSIPTPHQIKDTSFPRHKNGSMHTMPGIPPSSKTKENEAGGDCFPKTVILRAHGAFVRFALSQSVHPSRDDVMWGSQHCSTTRHVHANFPKPMDDMGMEFQYPPFRTSFDHRSHILLAILAQAEITSESVANGLALQIVPSKRASGKTI